MGGEKKKYLVPKCYAGVGRKKYCRTPKTNRKLSKQSAGPAKEKQAPGSNRRGTPPEERNAKLISGLKGATPLVTTPRPNAKIQ